MTVWAYYRVSSDYQNYESQRMGIIDYVRNHRMIIDKEVIDNGISGTIPAIKRKLNYIMRKAQPDDIVLVSELSRLGRSTPDVLKTCDVFVRHKVKVYCIKQGITIDSSPMGKMVVAVLAAFSEMERDLISQRTKEGLARVKASGRKLGRAFGSKNKTFKLAGCEEKIKELLAQGIKKTQICKEFGVNRSTLYFFINKYINVETNFKEYL